MNADNVYLAGAYAVIAIISYAEGGWILGTMCMFMVAFHLALAEGLIGE